MKTANWMLILVIPLAAVGAGVVVGESYKIMHHTGVNRAEGVDTAHVDPGIGIGEPILSYGTDTKGVGGGCDTTCPRLLEASQLDEAQKLVKQHTELTDDLIALEGNKHIGIVTIEVDICADPDGTNGVGVYRKEIEQCHEKYQVNGRDSKGGEFGYYDGVRALKVYKGTPAPKYIIDEIRGELTKIDTKLASLGVKP